MAATRGDLTPAGSWPASSPEALGHLLAAAIDVGAVAENGRDDRQPLNRLRAQRSRDGARR